MSLPNVLPFSRSIQGSLLTSLLVGVLVAASTDILSDYVINKKNIRQQCDRELESSAVMINSFTLALDVQWTKNPLPNLQFPSQFQIQVTHYVSPDSSPASGTGPVLFRSSPEFRLEPEQIQDGFSTVQLGKTRWRVFTTPNGHWRSWLSLGVDETVYQELEAQNVHNMILVAAWVYPFLAFFVWASIARALRLIARTTRALVDDPCTEDVPLFDMPKELQPLILAFHRKLRSLQQILGSHQRFTSDAAHELRTPLAALKAQTQVAILFGNLNQEQVDLLSSILKNIERSIHTVEQLLVLHRIGHPSVQKKPQAVALRRVLVETMAQIGPLAIEKEIELTLSEEGKAVVIEGQPAHLSILVRNLIDNAIRYTPSGGHIDVRLVPKRKTAILCVSDSGPGISESHRREVFRRFFRVSGTKEAGCGLGLSIVREIVQQHQARIRLCAPKSGTGLVILVFFPLAPSGSLMSPSRRTAHNRGSP